MRAGSRCPSVLALSGSLVLGFACGGDAPRDIAIDVKTDYVAGREFAVVFVYGGSATGDGEPSFADDVYALPGEAFDLGVRVGTTARLGGVMVFEAQLYDPAVVAGDDPFAEPFAYSFVMLEDQTVPALTLVVSRSCENVDCLVGPDRMPQVCRGGACVDARCAPEVDDTCGPPQCTSDAQCAAAAPCVRTRCDEGVCLATPRDYLCSTGEICDPTSGCVAP